MFLFIDTIKRLLDEDHGAPVNNRETLEKLLKRYRVKSIEKRKREMRMKCLGYAGRCVQSPTRDRLSQ